LTPNTKKILVYGYGNPGRQDDGLGVLIAEEIEQWSKENNFEHIQTDSNYQLNLEDATTIANFDVVVFADASREEINNFSLERIIPCDKTEFTMHSVAPAFILHVCKQVFNRIPDAYVLRVRGYEWEFMETMTDKAKESFFEAVNFLKSFIQNYPNPVV
jgi:hydrogenase maturation protease